MDSDTSLPSTDSLCHTRILEITHELESVLLSLLLELPVMLEFLGSLPYFLFLHLVFSHCHLNFVGYVCFFCVSA